MRSYIFLVDIIGSIVTATNAALTGSKRPPGYTPNTINYLYGDKDEITGRMRELVENQNTDATAFPLIGLVMPFKENYGSRPDAGVFGEVVFPEIIIAQRSTSTDDFPTRYVQVMKPVVYPIYNTFLTQLALSGKFNTGLETRRIQHTKTDVPNAVPPKKQDAGLNDYIDAIIITNLTLTINQDACLSSN